jgi:hypothetical protein
MSYLLLVAIKICLCGSPSENKRWEPIIETFNCNAVSSTEFECVMPLMLANKKESI